MLDRCTIKFGPAVSQKELEKALHEDGNLSHVHKLKAWIEPIGDAEDIQKLRRVLERWKKAD